MPASGWRARMPEPPTILLVDDEDAVQKLLTYPLEREGYRVVSARDGEEALDRFGDANPDLVVLDIMLPRLDGLEVCKRLRARSTVPIIMLTARDDELDKVVGLELGADDYITKPFSIREFRSRVRALLRRAKLPAYQGDEADEVIAAGPLRIDLSRRSVELGRLGGAAHVRRVRAPADHGLESRARLLAQDAPRGALGRLRLPRAADDRRPRAAPAREARARPERARVHPHGARRRLPVPRAMNPLRSVGARLSLALVAVVALALVLVYVIVVPSLRSRLVDAKLNRMEKELPTVVAEIPVTDAKSNWADNLERWSGRADARVVVYYDSRAPRTATPVEL